MKKFSLFAVSLMAVATLNAQTVNIHFKNGQTIEYPSDNVDYVDFSLKAADPTLTAGQVIDLGLSVYWASCNLGAESPEEYGNYYAWGETRPKSDYEEKNYSYYDNNIKQYIDIGEDIAGTEYDAATANWGSDWRMPTKEQMRELVDNCTWEWTQINGINGYKITGTNGNSIFLPAAGFNNISISKNEQLLYWTSSESSDGIAFQLHVYGAEIHTAGNNKYWGCSIRPVTSNPNAGGTPTDHSQDHLVTDNISASFAGGAYSSVNGLITNGSKLMWRFKNGSNQSVTLIGIQLINGSTGAEGNNMLSEEENVAAGEIKSYTTTVGLSGIRQPKIRFTYRYNNKLYTVEASMPD